MLLTLTRFYLRISKSFLFINAKLEILIIKYKKSRKPQLKQPMHVTITRLFSGDYSKQMINCALLNVHLEKIQFVWSCVHCQWKAYVVWPLHKEWIFILSHLVSHEVIFSELLYLFSKRIRQGRVLGTYCLDPPWQRLRIELITQWMSPSNLLYSSSTIRNEFQMKFH